MMDHYLTIIALPLIRQAQTIFLTQDLGQRVANFMNISDRTIEKNLLV